MKDVYSFVATKDNAIVGCDSRLLSTEDDAYQLAKDLFGIFIDINNVEIFRYDNKKFVFIGSMHE